MYLDDAALDGGERMSMRVRRPGVRDGYDAWSTTYDETPNPLVALDRRYTMRLLELDSRGDLSLTNDLSKDIPSYAILSHTWAAAAKPATWSFSHSLSN